MKGNKRGVVEVQFNWIFIVIVGVIILTFFISLAGWYKEKSDIDIAYEALGKIESIATGAQVSSDTNSEIEIPRIEFQFECESDGCTADGCYSTIDFENKGVSGKPWTDVEVLFAPRKVKDDFLYSWSLSWKIPYRVSDFLYLTSSNIQYIIVGETELANEIYEKLLENKFIDIKQIPSFSAAAVAKGKRVKLIYFNDPSSDASDIYDVFRKDLDRIVGITQFDGNQESGEAKFYHFVPDGSGGYYLNPEGSYGYLMMPSIIGAVFSPDSVFYECNMKKASLRAKTVSSVYANKVQLLSDPSEYPDYSGVCANIYSDSESLIASIGAMFPDGLENPDQYVSAIESLESKNEGLLLKDCPRIY